MNSLFTIALLFKVLDNATAPVRKINDTLGETGKNLDKAATKSTALNTGLENMGRGVAVADRVARGVERIGKMAEGATAKLDALQKKAQKLGESAEKLETLGRIGATVGTVGAVGIEKTIEEFASLEEAQKRLRTTLMDNAGKVGPEFEQLNALAERLGSDLPGSTKDMVQMFIALREQGVQTRFILGGTGEAAAKFAALMKLGFAESATHVAKFSESMGVADTDMVKFMDLLQRLKYASGVEVGDLAYTFKYAGGSLKLLGLQGLAAARDFSAVVGVLAAAGIEGSTAGTNMAQAMARMAEIGSRLDSGKIKKLVAPILDKYGIQLEFFTDAGEFKGLRPMVEQLEKLKALNPQEQILVLKKLFGDEAARPLAVLLKSGVAGYDEMLRRITAQAEMETKIKEIMSGTAMQWETMTGTVQNLTAHIGGIFAKLINLPSLLGRLNDLFSRMDSWALLHPKTAGVLAGVVLAVMGLSLAGGALLLTMAGLGAAVPRALEGLTVLGRGATWATGRITALYLAMRRRWVLGRLPDAMFGDVIPGAAQAQTGIRGVMATTRLWIATQLTALRTSYMAAGGVTGLSRAIGGGLAGGLRTGIVALRAFSIALVSTPIGWIGIAVGVASLLIYRYWRPISGFFRGLWTGLREGLKGLEPAWDVFTRVARIVLASVLVPLRLIWRLVSALISPVNSTGAAAENMGRRFGRAIGGMLSAILQLPARMLTAGANIIDSLFKGMMSKLDKPISAMKGLATRIRGFLPFSPAKEGALRDINRIRLVETIAESVRPAPLVNAMRTVTAATMIAATPVGARPAVLPAPVLQVPGQTQAINQLLNPATVPMVPDQTQRIRQAVEAARLPEMETATRRINQVAQPVRLPAIPGQTQAINQLLNPATVPVIPDQTQRIRQAVEAARLPEMETATRRINHVAQPVRLPAIPGQTQAVNQLLRPASVPVVPDQTQRIRQTVEAARLPEVEAATRRISQVAQPLGNAPSPTVPADRPLTIPVADLARTGSTTPAASPMQITFSPQITIQGSGNPDQAKNQINEAMRMSFTEFERMMKRYEDQKVRKSF